MYSRQIIENLRCRFDNAMRVVVLSCQLPKRISLRTGLHIHIDRRCLLYTADVDRQLFGITCLFTTCSLFNDAFSVTQTI
jgi:hypothetical protein